MLLFLPWEKDSISKVATKSSLLVKMINTPLVRQYIPRKGGVGGEGTYVYLWLFVVVEQKPAQHCKAIILQLKKK